MDTKPAVPSAQEVSVSVAAEYKRERKLGLGRPRDFVCWPGENRAYTESRSNSEEPRELKMIG